MKLLALSGKYGEGKFSEIDDIDFDMVSKYKWYLYYFKTSSNYYIKRGFKINGKWKTIYLHKYIMNVDTAIDHVDGNTLNNKRSNLRVCTHSGNSRNKKKNSNSQSKYKGVTKNTHPNRPYVYWKARIKLVDRSITLGNFPFNEEGEVLAAKAYNEAAIKYFGEFARLNTIPL